MDTSNLKFAEKGILYQSSEQRDNYVVKIKGARIEKDNLFNSSTNGLALLATASRNLGMPKSDFSKLVSYYANLRTVSYTNKRLQGDKPCS